MKNIKKRFAPGGILALLAASLLTLSACATGESVNSVFSSTLQETTLPIDEDFHSIHILSDTEDITLLPAEDGGCRVVSYNNKKITYTAEVEDGTLKIRTEDTRKWYERIFGFGDKALTLYLPTGAYDSLTIEEDTGDVTVPADFRFTGDVTLALSTGNTDVRASVDGVLSIAASTGDVFVGDNACGTLSVSTSTGDVTLANLASGDLTVKVSTGHITLTNVRCDDLLSTGSSGDVRMTDVIANGAICMERSTGDVIMDRCDAAELVLTIGTGDVCGTLLSDKVFIVRTNAGNINVPETVKGGICKINTSTGNIEIAIAP